jgi:hypothetical protein
VQARGGTGEAALLGYGEEGFQLKQIHLHLGQSEMLRG